jgi:hypothetical protein
MSSGDASDGRLADRRPNDDPEVSIVIVTHDGRELLASCLESLAGLDYPADRIETMVYDNGSRDGTIDWLRVRHPAVRAIAGDRNLGFAAANNRAAREASARLLCLVNNDMRFAPGFLRELVAVHATSGAASVGARVLDWAGETIEFDGGTMNFYGHGAPRHHGVPAGAHEAEIDPFPTLFASGGAMLVERAAFIAAGGFDDRYFAYFEDVDLGWRLWLLGERCMHAPAARVMHRGHASEGALGPDGRLALIERNALLTIYKNYERERGERVLRCALALLAERIRLAPERRSACTRGLIEFLAAMPGAERDRAALERRRVRGDAEIAPLFVEPFRPPIGGAEYLEIQRELAGLFDAAELFTPTAGVGELPPAGSEAPAAGAGDGPPRLAGIGWA